MRAASAGLCMSALLLSLDAASASAQQGRVPAFVAADSVTIVPDTAFAAGGLHRLLFGDHWRGAWQVPVRIPVLPLAAVDGGLVPVRRGGGKQTKSLRFASPSGREYVVRSLAKDPSPLVPPELRGSLVTEVLDDQISGSHPLAPLVVDRLLDAVDVPHASPVLVQLPREGLGEFTAEFGGMIGFLERRATDEDAEAFGGDAIEGTFDLLEKLDGDGRHRVDARAFLAARLMDVWLGDWDRHADQWRWARRDSAGLRLWRPVPRDRDQAFARYDGVLLWVARRIAPQLTVFDASFGAPEGLAWNARFLDRRLLGALPAAVWDSTARALASHLTDGVIDEALARLPADAAMGADRLRTALRARRDELPAAAERLRRLHATEAELYGTGRGDTLDVVRREGALAVRFVSGRGDTLALRDYPAEETHELRVFLGGGADVVRITGDGGPLLRVIGGTGKDQVEASSSRALRAYDADSIAVPRGVRVQRKTWPQDNAWAEGGRIPPRDWGGVPTGLPYVRFGPDIGLVVGTGIGRTTFGFRRVPNKVSVNGGLGFATGILGPIAALNVRWHGEQTSRATELQFLASGAEQLRWFGAGNETVRDTARRFYRARGITLRSRLLQHLPLGARASLAIGPEVRWTRTEESADRLIGRERPYGFGEFGRVAALAELTVDLRDAPSGASRGVFLALGGSASPAVWDVDDAYGEVHADLRTYLSPAGPMAPTLALRAGGRAVFGTVPFMDRAYVGGGATVRGLAEQRFAGTESAFGSAELRQALGRATLIVPMRIGLFGFGDAGRVWETGEDSDTWHWGVGGGIWGAVFQGGATFSLAFARSDDRTNGVYVRAGMAF